jgi:formylglycine-generating enzyme required for sulfatase activity
VSYEAASCNGADRDAIPEGAIESRMEPTGALAMCESEYGVLDLSGNVKEWTNDPRGVSEGGAAIYVVRGGSFESPSFGLTCQTDLSRATVDTLLPSIGFRCCRDDAP